jgi:hypothetical protein
LFKKSSLAGITGIVLLFSTCLAGALTVPTSAATVTTTFLGASNTQPAFNFMTQDFVESANGGNSVTFSFGGSGKLAGVLDGGVDFASDGTGNSPAGDALFASADEANVDNTIAAGAPAAKQRGDVAKYNTGQCIDKHSASYNGSNNDGTSCPGIGSTRAQYTTGRLVIFSCKAGGQTLAPAVNAPTCAEPVSGYFSQTGKSEAPSTMADVWADLLAHTAKSNGGTAAQNTGGYLAIADPKNGWTFSNTGCGPSVNVAPNAPYGLAGMESLYVAAVDYYSENPRHAFGATPAAEACREIDFMTGSGAALDNFSTTSPTSGGKNGGGNYSDPTLPIIFGDNVTYTQDTVIAGTSQIALLPKSFVVSPAGNDTNFWAVIPECGVASGQRASVLNGWTAKISGPEACADQDYVKGMHDNSAAKISSRNFGRNGADSPFTLVGEHGFYSPIRQWVVVENDDQDQSATADLSTRDGMAASAFIQYLLSAKGQAVLISFGYDPIS